MQIVTRPAPAGGRHVERLESGSRRRGVRYAAAARQLERDRRPSADAETRLLAVRIDHRSHARGWPPRSGTRT